MHVRSCCFTNQKPAQFVFFAVLVAVAVVVAYSIKHPIISYPTPPSKGKLMPNAPKVK